jgi:chorismate lyase/3-hydroxybenzoate synthase
VKTSFGALTISQNFGAIDKPAGHELLLGFGFGMSQGEAQHPQIAELGLQPANGKPCVEGWWYRGDVSYRIEDGIRIAECEDYTAMVAQVVEDHPTGISHLTRDVYLCLLNAFRNARHKHIVRIWNYFPEINHGEGDQERYRQFSIGRAEAYDRLGLSDKQSPPGTAIGSLEGDPLSVIAIASSLPFNLVENPRQLSAYSYPEYYGPRSPRFSRGGLLKTADGGLFLASGTAAIVGHASTYPHDVVEQSRETFRNLDSLLLNAGVQTGVQGMKAARVYMRNCDDLPAIRQAVEAELGVDAVPPVYLQGHICRRELLLEIDGVILT